MTNRANQGYAKLGQDYSDGRMTTRPGTSYAKFWWQISANVGGISLYASQGFLQIDVLLQLH